MRSDSPAAELTIESGIATLCLRRPARLNAFTAAMHQALRAALDRIESCGDVRALIITGEGRGFCAGADLIERAEMLARDGRLDLERSLSEEVNPLIVRLAHLPIPVISAVNGVAAGAGVGLALASDLVLAGRSARFQLSFASVGLALDAGLTWTLPQRVGTARAIGLALTGEPLSAERAHAWGLVWRVIDDDQLLSEARALAEQLSSLSLDALAAIKSQLRSSPSGSLDEALILEARTQGRLGARSAYARAVEAFARRRGRPNA